MVDMTSIRASDLAAERVRRLRTGRGWTVRQLADRCKEIGAPELSAAVIANIESGRRDKASGERRRDVTVDEVLALALALDAPPLLLFMPYNGWDQLKITSRIDAGTLTALDWISGDGEPPQLDGTDLGAWLTAAHPIVLYRQFRAAQSRVTQWLLSYGYELPEGSQLEDSPFTGLAEALNAMIGAGVSPPPLPEAWVRQMRPLLKDPSRVPVSDDNGEGGS